MRTERLSVQICFCRFSCACHSKSSPNQGLSLKLSPFVRKRDASLLPPQEESKLIILMRSRQHIHQIYISREWLRIFFAFFCEPGDFGFWVICKHWAKPCERYFLVDVGQRGASSCHV